MAAVGAEFKGKSKEPSFYKPAKSAPTPKKEQHWPLLIGGALAGAAILLYLRSRSGGSVSTGPVLSVVPSTTSDSAQIQNMQGTVNQILANPSLISGGTNPQLISSGSFVSGATPDSQTSVIPDSALGIPSPSSIPSNIVWTTSDFAQQFGSTPQQVYKDTLGKKIANGGSPNASTMTASDAQKYGGDAGLAAWSIVHGQMYSGEYFTAPGGQLVQFVNGKQTPVASPNYPNASASK